MSNITCSECGKGFFRSNIKPTKSGKSFCSRECHQRSQYVHGLNKAGYRITRVDGRQVYEHRAIMEGAIGRKLQTSEHVHHINGNKSDNRLSNLAILQKSAHHREHVTPTFDVELAKSLYVQGIGYKRLGKLFNRHPSSIRECFIGRGWHNPRNHRLPAQSAREAILVAFGNAP